MQFQVPQFLEVEDKLFGQFTLKQFLYVFGGLGLSYIAYAFLWIYLAVPIILVIMPFTVALAFYRPNKQPFINMVTAAIAYYISPQLYIWRKIPNPPKKDGTEEKTPTSGIYVPPLSENRLKDLSWSLDIKNNMDYGRTKEEEAKDSKETHKVPLLKDI